MVDAGKPRNRFAAHSHGFLGQDGRAPTAIVSVAREQLLAYPTAAFVRDEAVDATPSEDGFALRLASGAGMYGSRLASPPAWKTNCRQSSRPGRTWAAQCCMSVLPRRRIAGGTLGVLADDGRSVHQALLVADWGDVVLFADDAFALDDAQRAALASRGVRIEPVAVRAMTTVDGRESVHLADGREVALSALFVATRTRPASALAERLGCAFDDGPQGPVLRVDAKQATTVPGVFAAGDAANPMSNATLASASGVMAGVFAHQSLALPA